MNIGDICEITNIDEYSDFPLWYLGERGNIIHVCTNGIIKLKLRCKTELYIYPKDLKLKEMK